MRRYFSDTELYEKTLNCYLDLISDTADFLLHLSLLADLSVQLLCQVAVVLGLVTEGSCRSQISITFNQIPPMSSCHQKAPK